MKVLPFGATGASPCRAFINIVLLRYENRGVLIVESDAFNRSRLNTVVAVLLSTNTRLLDAPGNVLLPAEATALRKDSVANVSQVIAVDRDFLVELAGKVRGQLLKDVGQGLRLVLGL